MQMTRMLASFDGKTLADQDFNGNGEPTTSPATSTATASSTWAARRAYYASGGSLGGIVSMIQGALDPHVVAAAPVSGRRGFMDTAMRGVVTPVPVLEQVLGPLIVAVPGHEPLGLGVHERRSGSVRWVVNDLFDTKEMEIACLDAAELDAGMTVSW